MKKYKMMALTGILLSSTILGANTSVVQAATTSKASDAITVDKSAIADVIQVINDLLNNASTANKVNAQTQFSDLIDGNTYSAAPIFGQKTASAYSNALQGELNVVDTNSQLVPMKVVTTGAMGTASQVSYTLDGTTKTINVEYNYNVPTISLGDSVMNFKSTDDKTSVNSAATSKTSVDVNSSNGEGVNGTANTKEVSTVEPTDVDLTSNAPQSIKFTPKDSYVSSGIADSRTVNVYSEPKWATVAQNKFQDGDDVSKNTFVYVNPAGQRYLYNLTKGSEDGTVDYTATAIDAVGNAVKDNLTGNPITFSETNQPLSVEDGHSDKENPRYTLIFTYDGKTVATSTTTGKYDEDTKTVAVSAADVTSAAKAAGYDLVATPIDTTIDAESGVNNLTKTYAVKKTNTETINYYDVTNTKDVTSTVGTKNISGRIGSTQFITAPDGYKLVDTSDSMQKIGTVDKATKNVYVTPTKNNYVKNLSYTVTFKDINTGKTVGSQVKSEGTLGSYISLTAPEDYAFATIADNGFLLLKDNQNVTKYVTAANTPYDVSYVDQDSGEEVGTQSGKGADGSKVVLTAPTGYAFVNADDINYTIDSDTPSSTVYVTKSDQTEDNIVSGYPKNGNIKIYNSKGKLNDNVVLSEGTSWIIDQTQTINGAEYYRVATDEYVKASDVYKYVPLQSIAVTNGDNVTPVYNTKGQLILNRALDTNTPWYTDRSATIKGQKMYRVATDEWIKASDVTIK